MRSARLLILFLIACSSRLHAAQMHGSVYLMPINSESFSSWGNAEYLNDLNAVVPTAVLSGTHSVHGAQVFEHAVTGNGEYYYELEGPADPGACYGTTLYASSDPPGFLPFRSQTWTGDTRCRREGPIEISQTCPLILDLNDDGIHTTGLNDPVHFWIDLEGQSLTTAWTNPATEEGFLWIDLNHDHKAHVTELFGSRMVAPNGAYHANGFEALAKYDRPQYGGNHDGKITHSDWVWPHLRLWVDRNHDGVSQWWEISIPLLHRIVSLNLLYEEGETYDYNGNEMYLISSYEVRRLWGQTEERTMADIEFLYIPN
jgi:hypothetical protein